MNEAHLLQALKRKLNHAPRTRYWSAAGQPKYTNELILTDSPYLLQHAHNPIGWRVWSEEAFEEANRLDKPVFLSIGYSTCHWCHVMERESFEDAEIAEFMNQHFIPIKVDREELPDVDAVYMDFLQITTGKGGWPMNIFLTPEKRPLYASTYLPPRDGDRGVKVGLFSYLKAMHKNWRDPKLTAQGDAPLQVLRDYAVQPPVHQLSAEWIDDAAQAWMTDFDEDWGGFSAPPKFIRPSMLEALLRAWHRGGDPSYLKAVEVTLERMYCGGIYDHIGGGVARYSVDNRWWLPHFEKMLYDNAQLIIIALETFQVTKRPLYAQIARDCLNFVERELQVRSGAWGAAIDAESLNERGDRVEGYFYTWTLAELRRVLSEEELEWVVATFGLTEDGNIHHQSSQEETETNETEPSEEKSDVSPEEQSRIQSHTKMLKTRNLFRVYEPLDEDEQRYWKPLKEKLYRVREQRPHPARDEQVICAWNALMLSAFSKAAIVLADSHYQLLAKNTANFLIERLWDGARVKRAWRAEGDPKNQPDGVLEDYMALCVGMLDYFEACGDVEILHQAIEVYEAAEIFFDRERGGFFRCPLERRSMLPYEEKPLIDGAEPSGNALAAIAALRLHHLTDIPHYRAQADSTLKAIGPIMSAQPTATPKALCALAHWFGSRGQMVVIHLPDGEDCVRHPLSMTYGQMYLPFTVRLVFNHISEPLKQHIPILSKRPVEADSAHALICSIRGCTPPIAQPSALRSALSQLDS
jgi:uncharacterized protein